MSEQEDYRKILTGLEKEFDQELPEDLRERLGSFKADVAAQILTTVRSRVNNILSFAPGSSINLASQISRELDKLKDLEAFKAYYDYMESVGLTPIPEKSFLADTNKVRTRWSHIVKHNLFPETIVVRMKMDGSGPFLNQRLRPISSLARNCQINFAENGRQYFCPLNYLPHTKE